LAHPDNRCDRVPEASAEPVSVKGGKEWPLEIGALVFAPIFFFKYLIDGEALKACLALAVFVVAALVLGWTRSND
jgi:hypothetical protein